jgi:hypothetical protein
MAFDTANLDGTVVAPGGIVPFGALKDAPSGTRVNTKMLGDMWQMLQQLAAGAGITLNNQPDNNTNGYQFTEALSKVIGNHAGQIVISLIGGDYDPTKVYILWGCATRADEGTCLYDGEIYRIQGNAGFPCGGSLVDVLTFFSPTLYTNGVQTLQLVCATSGSGIANFADVIYLQKWVDVSSTMTWGNGPGGSVTIDPADFVYARYLLRGKTVIFQMSVQNFTVGVTGPAYISFDLAFLPSDITEPMWSNGGVYIPPSGGRESCLVLTGNAATEFIRVYAPPSGWVTGTDDSRLDVTVTFEID